MASLFYRFNSTGFFLKNLAQLKDNIRREIRDIDNELFPKGMQNIAVRMRKVIGLRGAYVKHVV